MVISAIRKQDIIYVMAHAEQSYTGTFLADKGDPNTHISQGILGVELTRETLLNIAEFVKNQPQPFSLVIDFSKIKDIQSNQQKWVIELKKRVQKLIFTNISDFIVKKLNIDLYDHNEISGDAYAAFYLTDAKEQIQLENLDALFEDAFVARLQKSVIETKTEDGYRSNSPIYIPKFVDIKSIIVEDPHFFLYVVYRLATTINLKREWAEHAVKPILFCQNLNGAYIASILSSFLKWNLLSMDHIGPVNKVYTNIGSKIKSDARYLVVSDMICLGTELRICQNIINYSGGRYIGNASIIKVNTLIPEHQPKDAVSVYEISKGHNPIDFKILTALD
ncbi:hypothetical protein [Mucilaginibacter sp. L196]|uniref:hypothetical protein n=1 Tax=Mucilaginibacter sp. L196 TaxID=1641870 RepID=UPI00131C80FF|nr:hypothetical protein [Mucilaginibacter sp. L196]